MYTQKNAMTPACRHSVSVMQKSQQNDENITVSEIRHSNVKFASQKKVTGMQGSFYCDVLITSFIFVLVFYLFVLAVAFAIQTVN
uniref:Neur_chan_memb domain-containing protein n=1 Tax=Panagrellus redivivus TaxID=6233 RepID=A0A7E4VT84_PANRE